MPTASECYTRLCARFPEFTVGGDSNVLIIGRKVEGKSEVYMEFFNSAVGVLQTLVIALGAGLGIWGAINLMEGYGNDNPGANAHMR